jgi:hypothetical protein
MPVESLREQLEAVWDDTEKDEGQEAGRSAENTEESLGLTSEEGGEGGPADRSDAEETPAAAEDDDKGGESEVTRPEKAEESVVGIKAPQSWKPQVREHWPKLPKDVQLEVQRREKHIENTLRETAEARRLAEEFQNTIRPFEPLIASQNSTPIQAVKNLMTSAAGLTIGTPLQKAQIVTNIIRQYGVDIQALDQLLVGETPQAGPDPQIQQYLQQQLAPVQQFVAQLQQQKQQYEQTHTQQLQSEIAEFSQTADFFEDVREHMADLLEVASRRGQSMSLQQAYDIACRSNPDVAPLYTRKEAVQQASVRQQEIQSKKRTASSISGAQRTSPPPSGESSIRDALEAAWEDRT